MEGSPVKAIRMLYVVALLALCLVLGCSGNQGTPASSTENPNAPGGGNASGGSAAGGKAAAGSAGSKSAAGKPVKEAITIPAGTVITVRLGETLSSKSSSAGQGFAATVDGKSQRLNSSNVSE